MLQMQMQIRRDEHGTHKHAHCSWILCSVSIQSEIRDVFLLKMNSKLTSGLLCRHKRLVVGESDLNLLKTKILNVTFITSQ